MYGGAAVIANVHGLPKIGRQRCGGNPQVRRRGDHRRLQHAHGIDGNDRHVSGRGFNRDCALWDRVAGGRRIRDLQFELLSRHQGFQLRLKRGISGLRLLQRKGFRQMAADTDTLGLVGRLAFDAQKMRVERLHGHRTPNRGFDRQGYETLRGVIASDRGDRLGDVAIEIAGVELDGYLAGLARLDEPVPRTGRGAVSTSAHTGNLENSIAGIRKNEIMALRYADQHLAKFVHQLGKLNARLRLGQHARGRAEQQNHESHSYFFPGSGFRAAALVRAKLV